jgi:hypothetical protein
VSSQSARSGQAANLARETTLRARRAVEGTGTSAAAAGLKTGRTYTGVAYTVDQYGNVSAPVETSVTF